jgi:hypothetical protein
VKTIVLLKSEYFINQERKLEVRNYEFPVEKKSRFEREHRIEAKTIEVIHNLYDYYKKLMPQLYLNPNSVIKTVSNETKIKKGTVKKILSEEIVLPKKFKNSPKKFSFDSFDKNIIHEKINKFHKKKFSLQLETFSMKLKKMKIQVLKDVVMKLLGNFLKKWDSNL